MDRGLSQAAHLGLPFRALPGPVNLLSASHILHPVALEVSSLGSQSLMSQAMSSWGPSLQETFIHF